MRVHAYASQPHYALHLRDLWNSLHPSLRGEWVGPMGSIPLGDGALVAAWSDALQIRRPFVYVEHGAGQQYRLKGSPLLNGYSGSPGLTGAMGFLCPSEAVAARWRASYPSKPAVAVGAPSYLEPARRRGLPPRATVTFSFHWGAHPQIAELNSVIDRFAPAMPAVVGRLRSMGVEVLATAHPRRMESAVWTRLGVPFLRDWPTVLERTTCYVVDNSSTAFEAVAAGRSVVFMRGANWSDVHGPPRFDGDLPGPEVTDPGKLVAAIEDAMFHSRWAEARTRCVEKVYDGIVGQSARIGANAVGEMVAQRETMRR